MLYPHVQLTLLELAKRGIKLGVVSDAPRAQVWLRLCSLALQHVFDAVVDLRRHAASASPARRRSARCCAGSGRARRIADGGRLARARRGGRAQLGMKTVFARYGDTFGTVESGADYDIDDVYELVAIVDRLNKVT